MYLCGFPIARSDGFLIPNAVPIPIPIPETQTPQTIFPFMRRVRESPNVMPSYAVSKGYGE